MSKPTKFNAAGKRKRFSTCCATPKVTSPWPLSIGTQLTDPILLGKYRDVTRKHLGTLIDQLFAEFTGLHFHISWTPSEGRDFDTRTLPTGCSVCSRLSGSTLQPACKICGPKRLARALSTNGDGYRFTCKLGVRNYWLALRVRGEIVGLAYLQALDGGNGARRTGKAASRGRIKAMNREEFVRAAKLLRFMVWHVQTSTLADLRKADLVDARRAILSLEKEQALLRKSLPQPSPSRMAVHRPSGESHAQQIVHRLLWLAEQDYGESLTLKQCADKLGMNAAYLSDLFSHAVGVPFKTHLTEMRMAKAKELLSDPRKNLAEVAGAVGYASENRFRIAFKKATGLCPKSWRETMQNIQA